MAWVARILARFAPRHRVPLPLRRTEAPSSKTHGTRTVYINRGPRPVERHFAGNLPRERIGIGKTFRQPSQTGNFHIRPAFSPKRGGQSARGIRTTMSDTMPVRGLPAGVWPAIAINLPTERAAPPAAQERLASGGRAPESARHRRNCASAPRPQCSW